MATRVGILITGNEVLLGKTRDTNGPFMSTELRRIGLEVSRLIVCGDDEKILSESLLFLASDADIILMTGGLGPTSDDLTAKVLADVFGRPQVFNEEAWADCLAHFEKIGRTEVPESNRKQALLPENSVILKNPNGTAVGFLCEGAFRGRPVKVCCMPGVPSELEPMFLNEVVPLFRPRGFRTVEGVWQVFQLGESAMQVRVSDLEKKIRDFEVKSVISYQAHQGYVTYTLAFLPEDSVQARLAEIFLQTEVAPEVELAFHRHILYRSDVRIPAFICNEMASLNIPLALAESCTGGALARSLTAVPGASAYFLGCAVTYSNQAKHDLLRVPAETLSLNGAVSTFTAAAMAKGALRAFDARVALAVTGVAGPNGGTTASPVGTVCFAIVVSEANASVKKRISERLADFGFQNLDEQGGILGPISSQSSLAEVNEPLTLVSRHSFGSKLSREAIQMRACVFAQGALALLVTSYG